MRFALLVALLMIGLSLAGCMVEQEATGGEQRSFQVNVPADATSIRVDVTATARSGEPDVTILIEDEDGNNLASETFSVRGTTTRSLSANAAGHDRMVVTVRVVDGDAELDVTITAVVPQGQPIVVIRERVIIVQTGSAPTPTTTTPTPTPSPTPTPTPSPTPTPTPPTNETNTTNATI